MFSPLAKADMAGQLFVREFELNARGKKLSRRIRLSKDRPAFLRMPFAEAIKFFSERFGTDEQVSRFFQAYIKRSQDVADETLTVMARRAVDSLSASLRDGGSMDGWIAEFSNQGLPTPYLENVYRTNIGISYGAGRVREIDRSIDSVGYIQYRTSQDSRVRETHRKLDGKVWKADDPQWRQFAPPNGYQCRCTIVTIEAEDLEPGTTFGVKGNASEYADPGFATSPTNMVLDGA